MEKKYFYFQPQYVNKFKCDGSKCDAHCCGGWKIFIDKETYNKYPQDITAHMKFYPDRGEYLIVLEGKKHCPFLNENKLCSIQLRYGEKFLSKTCATYPRITNHFDYFFERALIPSCPVAAELILFEREPMQFEFVEVSEETHSLDGKFLFQLTKSTDELKAHLIEIQIAMISILQERTLSIDQRLIVLGFFVDKLGEIFSNFDEDALKKLIAAYESKKFLAEQVPLMLRSVSFDRKKFEELMTELLEKMFDDNSSPQDKKFSTAVNDALQHSADEKNFRAEYSTFFENYLVNELFMNIFPWKLEGNVTQIFAVFVAEYKLFERITFSIYLKGWGDKKNLIELASWLTTRFNHSEEYKQKILNRFKDADEPFSIMESLLEGSD